MFKYKNRVREMTRKTARVNVYSSELSDVNSELFVLAKSIKRSNTDQPEIKV